MNTNKEFFEQIDKISKEELTKLIKLIDGTQITKFTFKISLPNDVMNSFSLSEDLSFLVDSTPTDNKMKYYYKNLPIEPIHYYLRPDDYHEVSTLEMLQQCIHQDTHKPDITFLERGDLIRKVN